MSNGCRLVSISKRHHKKPFRCVPDCSCTCYPVWQNVLSEGEITKQLVTKKVSSQGVFTPPSQGPCRCFDPYSKKRYLEIRTLLPNFTSSLQQTNFLASLLSSVFFFFFFCRINKSLVLLDGGLLGTPIS